MPVKNTYVERIDIYGFYYSFIAIFRHGTHDATLRHREDALAVSIV